MPKARSSDRSLASLSHPRRSRPSPPPLPPRGCRLHSGFQTSASPPREKRQRREVRTAESSSERPRVDGRDGKRGTVRGCNGRGVDTLLGISTYDCPGGVHRSAKQSSPGLDPSRALRALFSTPPPERGNVSRYTREHRGVGYLSTVRCCCLVSGSIYSTRTHDLRNSRGSPMWLFFLLPLSSSLSLVCVYVCLPRSRSPTIFFSYGRNGSADVADLRRAEFGRRSFVLARYFR